MKPMDIEACRGLVALYGAPEWAPVAEWERFDPAMEKKLQHPLQQWVDALPPPQRQEVHLSYKYNMSNQTEAWAQAIFEALWH